MECFFCRIRDKELEHGIFFEDEKCFAIPDKHPVNSGHILLISKVHESDFWNLDKEIFKHLASVAQHLSEVLIEEYKVPKIDFIISGFQIPHTHIHLIPVNRDMDLFGSYVPKNRITLNEIEIEEIKNKIKSKL